MRKIVSIYTKRNAVEIYRNFRPLEHSGHKVTFRDSIAKKRRKLFEIAEMLWKEGDIWFLKYIPNNNLLNVICSAKQYLAEQGKKVTLVCDQDDNVFELPWGNLAMFYWQRPRYEKQAQLLATADWVICSTAPLEAYLKRFNEHTVVIPNMIDPKDWNPGRKRPKNKKVKIGWVFSQTHVPDLPVINEALCDIMEEFKDEAEFEMLGGEKHIFGFDYEAPKGCAFVDYPKRLEELNWDISIGPLTKSIFNDCKSNIKWLEATMAGAAFIGSKVYPYEHSIKNGITGFICGSKRQWKNALRKLITDERLRREIVVNARYEVMNKYNIENGAKTIHDFFEKI
jgi:glycosyltransferase involved in cell wall biosynthesis